MGGRWLTRHNTIIHHRAEADLVTWPCDYRPRVVRVHAIGVVLPAAAAAAAAAVAVEEEVVVAVASEAAVTEWWR